jgi:hypothetical protein
METLLSTPVRPGSAGLASRGIDKSLFTTELPVVLAALAALTVAEVWITGNWSVVSHPMWLDESVTSLLLNDRRFQHMLAAISGGVDTNGPSFYMVAWPLVHAIGGAITHLRVIAAVMMLLAVTGIYAACRCFVEPGRAAIGALSAMVHPFVLVQTWQVRMYGFWLAVIAWFCVYTVAASRTRSWPVRLAGCGLAVFVVTAHWLGIFALVLVSIAGLYETRADPARRRNHVLPLLAGLLTLALCLPLIWSQRHVLSVPTWIEPATLATIGVQLRWILLVPGTAVLVGYGLVRVLYRRGEPRSVRALTELLPVLSLFLFPVALIVMSLAMQSVLVERYMLPVVIPLSLTAAVAALPLRRRVGWLSAGIAAAALVLAGCLELNRLRAVTEPDDREAALVIDIVQRALASHQHLVFARRFEAYPLIQARPQWSDSVAVLDFAGMPDGLMRRTLFERDLGRAVSRFYGEYHLVTKDQLRQWGRFTVVTLSAEEDELRHLLPGFRITDVGIDEYLAEWQ